MRIRCKSTRLRAAHDCHVFGERPGFVATRPSRTAPHCLPLKRGFGAGTARGGVTLRRMHTAYTYLGIAILAEVIATSFLKASDGMSKLWPTLASVLGYAVAFTFLSFTLKTIPTGIAYALWSAVGIVLISIVSWLWFGQSLDAPAVGGLALIVCGVVVINVFSKSVGH